MLDTAGANAKALALNTAFAAIGGGGDTRMPPSKKNTEPTAWEYHVACHLFRLADARKTKAQASAVKLGVLFDHKAHPMPVGTDTLVYGGDVVEVSVAVTTATTKLDVIELGVDLVKLGIKMPVLERLLRKHTHDNACPHKFSSSLVTK
jgi:hypothetical protein